MSNNISLTASMRSNLLSLQNIAGQVDLTQNRLSTGLKVNSAIDNPSSYYTAVSLNNRASDLSALLDSMAQGIQTIKAATEGLEAGAKLLEQASATQALETVNIPSKSWFEEQEGVAAVVSTKEEFLAAIDSGKKGDIVIYGQIDMGNTAITLKEGQNLTGIGAYGVADNERGKFSALNFDVTGMSATKMITTSGNLCDLSIHATGDAGGVAYGMIRITRNTDGVTFKDLDLYCYMDNPGYYRSLIVGDNKNNCVVNVQGINNFYLESTQQRYSQTWQNCYIKTSSGTVMNINESGNAFFDTICEFNDTMVNAKATREDYYFSDVTCNGTTQLNGFISVGETTLTLNDQSQVYNANTKTVALVINSAEASFHLRNGYSDLLGKSTIFKAVAGSKIGIKG